MRRRAEVLARMMERRWSEAEASYHAKILDSLAPDPSAIALDFGCDAGGWTDEVRRLGVLPDQVHGLELVARHAHFLAVVARRSPSRQEPPVAAPALRSR